MTHIACFVAGIISVIIFAIIRLKLMKRTALQKPAICVHCKALIEVEDTNHWERCVHHPAWKKVMELMNENEALSQLLKRRLNRD